MVAAISDKIREATYSLLCFSSSTPVSNWSEGEWLPVPQVQLPGFDIRAIVVDNRYADLAQEQDGELAALLKVLR